MLPQIKHIYGQILKKILYIKMMIFNIMFPNNLHKKEKKNHII